MSELDQWADARRPPADDANPVTAAELASIIYRMSPRVAGSAPWGDLDSGVQKAHERVAERILVEVGARDLSDPQRALLARIRSAGDSAVSEIEDAASTISNAVDEALGTLGVNVEAPRVEGWVEGVRYVCDELDAHGLADLFGGTSPLDEALRAFQREAHQKEAPR